MRVRVGVCVCVKDDVSRGGFFQNHVFRCLKYLNPSNHTSTHEAAAIAILKSRRVVERLKGISLEGV